VIETIKKFIFQVEHIDWHDHYVHLRSAAGIEFPGTFGRSGSVVEKFF
jgi:hypothetical protein